ncbi:hypothetical protein E2R34_05650 [Rathayibacter toxicus]|nr:hypothetical protein E2R34_05650 [Rathayibacter toxicus]
MVSPGTLLSSLDTCGVTAISGVPCSNFASVIEVLENNPNRNYVSAANEGEAVSIAAGTALAGGFSAVFMQNSGLGNAVNPLTSLTETLGTRMVLFISWRGSPELRDEPQHRIMGSITPALLDLMKIPLAHLATARRPHSRRGELGRRECPGPARRRSSTCTTRNVCEAVIPVRRS